MDKIREIIDWEKYYTEEEVEKMPWYHAELDPDLKGALEKLDIRSGEALDLGTGPGTQAMALASAGFKVTATDISRTAVELAREKAAKRGLDITFLEDDILSTGLDKEFDFIFDRGCFHSMHPEKRDEYVSIVAGLIKPGGYLFLKCFSRREKMEGGPYRFTPEELNGFFGLRLSVQSIEETVYHGTMDPQPFSLFSIIQRPKG
jgi:2-polyprenyl-3-methyl-5-hydroxy-6-metoxy-1,4-benzoquinol methylase